MGRWVGQFSRTIARKKEKKNEKGGYTSKNTPSIRQGCFLFLCWRVKSIVQKIPNARIISGNATIGLEILEDLPEVNTIIAPFGGGGLSCGIAAAMKAKEKTDVRVYACEVITF